MLKKEAGYRQKYIGWRFNGVSPLKKRLKMDRRQKSFNDTQDHYPGAGRLETRPGTYRFYGRSEPFPNYFGVDEVCKALNNYPGKGIELRLVGSSENRG
jgi:hypothetical protein